MGSEKIVRLREKEIGKNGDAGAFFDLKEQGKRRAAREKVDAAREKGSRMRPLSFIGKHKKGRRQNAVGVCCSTVSRDQQERKWELNAFSVF